VGTLLTILLGAWAGLATGVAWVMWGKWAAARAAYREQAGATAAWKRRAVEEGNRAAQLVHQNAELEREIRRHQDKLRQVIGGTASNIS